MNDKKRGSPPPKKPITPPKPATNGVQVGVPRPTKPIVPPKNK